MSCMEPEPMLLIFTLIRFIYDHIAWTFQGMQSNSSYIWYPTHSHCVSIFSYLHFDLVEPEFSFDGHTHSVTWHQERRMEELNLLTALQCSIATQFLTTVRVNLIVCVDGISITVCCLLSHRHSAKWLLDNVPNCLNRELGGSVIVSDYSGMDGEKRARPSVEIISV